MLNFKSNIGAYEHNLLAYERDIRGCKGANLHPGVNLLPGAKFSVGINQCSVHIISPVIDDCPTSGS